MGETKAWWKSRVLWLNALTVLGLILALPEVGAIIPGEALPFMTTVNAVINALLRFGGGMPLGTQDRISR